MGRPHGPWFHCFDARLVAGATAVARSARHAQCLLHATKGDT